MKQTSETTQKFWYSFPKYDRRFTTSCHLYQAPVILAQNSVKMPPYQGLTTVVYRVPTRAHSFRYRGVTVSHPKFRIFLIFFFLHDRRILISMPVL